MEEENSLHFDSVIKADEVRKNLHITIKTKENKTMETDKKTCAQLVYEKMQSRNEDLENLYNRMDDSDIYSENFSQEDADEARIELREFVLGSDSNRVVKIHLSTGGPADWIEVIMDEDDGYIRSMNYHYADWFDHAETKIDENSYLWNFAQDYVQGLI